MPVSDFLEKRPGLRGGRHVIKGTGIPVWIITERYRAGDSIATLAMDYKLDEKLIRAALEFEGIKNAL